MSMLRMRQLQAAILHELDSGAKTRDELLAAMVPLLNSIVVGFPADKAAEETAARESSADYAIASLIATFRVRWEGDRLEVFPQDERP